MHMSRVRRVAARLAVAALAITTPAVLAMPAASAATPTELFFSEYIEGSSNNKALEIYNGTGAPIDLAAGDYTIQQFSNGSSTAGLTLDLTGTVAAGDVHVVAHSSAVATILAQADQTTGAGLFNGDDAIVLRTGTTVIDSIGQVGADPGTEWGTGLTSTADNTLRRLASVCAGDTNAADPFDPSVEWTGFATDTFDGLGSHTATCGAGESTEPVINEFSASTAGTDVEYVEIHGAAEADLSDYTVLEIEGDAGASAGTVDEVISLGTTGGDGLYLADLPANALENGTLTLLLVKDFTGAMGNDLDTDNDGVLDTTPWAEIVDSVAVNDGGAGDLTRGAPVLGVAYDGLPFAPGGASRVPDGTDTDSAADWVRNDFDLAGIEGFAGTPMIGEAFNTPGAPNAVVVKEAPVERTIAQIQGTGSESPLVGKDVITTGVVTAAYPTGGFNGAYIQTPGTGGTAKVAGTDASDGIFVYSTFASRLAIGTCVEVKGTAIEFNGLTEITDAWVETLDECAAVTATDLATLPVTNVEKEVYEGMLVHPLGTYTITNNYQLNQYGQLGLAVGDEPLYQATDVVEPGAAALAYEEENRKKYITLDDGSSWDYLRNDAAKDSPLPYLSADTPMRTASQVTFQEPVILDYRFQWNYQPIGHVVGADDDDIPVDSENDRPKTAPEFGGNLTIGAFNVLNYFDDLGVDEEGCDYFADRYGNPVVTDFCEVRGAYSQAALEDQQAKLVAAINKSEADILGLMEIENSAGVSYLPGQPRDKALATLVMALNQAAGETRWAYVPSPVVTPPNEDIIRTAFIYNPNTVQALEASQILLDDAFADARYPLAQKFKATKTGNPFVMIANHFKSKGSGEDDGTGQGNANPSREVQAAALTEWAEEMYAGEAVFLVGDFNAYSRETPVQIIEAAGYTNLAKQADPSSATYQFSGRLGSLDHIFANTKAERLVTGAAVWDINADESIAFQYSRRNYNVVDFHVADEYASSDHDPVLVGLDTGPRGKKKK